MTDKGTTPIPSPPGRPFIGNLGDIDTSYPLGSLVTMAEKYGPIYQLHFPGRTLTIVSTQELVNECCDETRFGKKIENVLGEIRNGVHDGLFTANSDEPNWGLAHRILMPAFGPTKIRDMFDEMHDIASQLAMKWARHGASSPIMVTDDFTRLALDTLALCAMGYRFNSYYHDEMHPFIEAMGNFLTESGSRSRRAPFTSIFYRNADQKYWEDIDLLRDTALEVLESRKSDPADGRKDLLSAMLDGVDPKTHQKLSDGSIIDNLITFLIAGHETTSGLLSFALYNLIKNPDAYRKAQEEVDKVVGSGAVKAEHLSQLQYIPAVLRETLRLSATIPIFGVESKKDQLLAGKYFIPEGQQMSLLLAKSHVDPTVFGDTANEFIPDRMTDENFDRLNKEFPNCWKPFGNGMRACIGRPFAWQESLLTMVILLQNFNFRFDDAHYKLQIKQTLTIKPKDFFMRATLRDGLTATQLEQRLAGRGDQAGVNGNQPRTNGVAAAPGRGKAPKVQGKPLSIFYGSNTGTCEALAQRLASDAASHGFSASTVEPLDAANQKVPTDQPVVVITASYEGEPPDNAGLFVGWLESLKGKEMENVNYAVFGCGHHDWAQTFHRIPKLVDSTLEERGATRIAPIGLSDAAKGNMFTDFETWEDDVFWPAMSKKYVVAEAEGDTVSSALSVEFSTPRSSALRQDVKEAIVLHSKQITGPGVPPKREIEVQLPSGMSYSAGDYLAVLPLNPRESIHRVMRRFQIAWDAHITIAADGRTTLPTDTSLPVTDILGAYVELAQPITKRGITSLVEVAKNPASKKELSRLAGDAFNSEVSAKRVAILDLLERFPDVEIPFGTFLSLLPPMRVRQYSISSSPLAHPNRATLTYSVLDAPAHSDAAHRHLGVATSYLASLAPGDKLHVSVRPSHASFHLPADAERVPVVCFAAGAGVAPFRGFIQERAAQLAAGRALAPAMLFLGVRDPDADDLYREQLDRWEAMGAVAVRRAYSRRPDASAGCRHVQDRLWADRAEVFELWERGARIYVCGSRPVGEGVKEVVMRMAREMGEANGKPVDEEHMNKWFAGIKNERFTTDVFD